MAEKNGLFALIVHIIPQNSRFEWRAGWYGIFCPINGISLTGKEETMKAMKIVCAMLLLTATRLLAQLDERTERSVDQSKNASSREAKHKFVFGIKAGANRSNVYNSEGMDFIASPKNGFAGGIFAAIPIGGFIGLQHEVLIS